MDNLSFAKDKSKKIFVINDGDEEEASLPWLMSSGLSRHSRPSTRTLRNNDVRAIWRLTLHQCLGVFRSTGILPHHHPVALLRKHNEDLEMFPALLPYIKLPSGYKHHPCLETCRIRKIMRLQGRVLWGKGVPHSRGP